MKVPLLLKKKKKLYTLPNENEKEWNKINQLEILEIKNIV